jgi:MFS family permease
MAAYFYGYRALTLAAVFAHLALRAPWLSFVWAALLAVCATSNSIPASFYATVLFGRAHFTPVYSLLVMACAFGSAAGTPLSGLIFDLTQSYAFAWTLFAAGGVLTAVLLFSAYALRPEKLWRK